MPFQIHLNSWSEWLDFIHDRIGSENQITEQYLSYYNKKKKLLCPKHRDRTKYDAFISQANLTGSRRTIPIPKNTKKLKYSANFDHDAAENDTKTPLARMWIMQDLTQNTKHQVSAPKSDLETSDEKVDSLCKLIRENFDDELKFKVILMIPTFSNQPAANPKCYDIYFSQEKILQDQRITATSILDQPILTYHKYRTLSKYFNRKMQQYMLQNLDTLDLNKILRSTVSNHNAVNMNDTGIFSKLAYLLCFINAKKQYLCNYTNCSENMYEIYPEVHRAIMKCMFHYWLESQDVKNRYASVYEDLEDTDTDLSTEESFTPEQSDQEARLDVDEETLLQSVSRRVIEYRKMITSSESTSIVKKIEQFKNLDSDNQEISVKFENNNLEITDPTKICAHYEHIGMAEASEFDYSSLSAFNTGFPSYPTPRLCFYLNSIFRVELKKVLPSLFSDFFAETIVLFKTITFGNVGWYPINSLLLHIIVENGKTVPKGLTEQDLLKKSECRPDKRISLNFVNFKIEDLSMMLTNDRHLRRPHSRTGAPSLLINSHTLSSQYTKKLTQQILKYVDNRVETISFWNYEIRFKSIGHELVFLKNFFPQLRDINMLLSQRSNDYDKLAPVSNALSDINTTSIRDLWHNRHECSFDKINILIEGHKPLVLDIRNTTAYTVPQPKDEDPILENLLFTQNSATANESTDLDNELTLKLMHVAQLKWDHLQQLTQKPGFYVHINSIILHLIYQKQVPIAVKKDLVQKALNELSIPIKKLILTNNTSYIEGSRVVEEYLIFKANQSGESLLHIGQGNPNGIGQKLLCCLYYGWNVFQNTKELENLFLILLQQSYRVESMKHLLDLLTAKVIYENASRQLFVKYIAQHIYGQVREEEIDEILAAIEHGKEHTCSNNADYDECRKILTLFFTYFSKPKHDTLFKDQMLQLDANKLFFMILSAVAQGDVDRVEVVLNLAVELDYFSEVFNKTYTAVTIKNHLTREAITKQVDLEPMELSRTKQMLRNIYQKKLPLDEKFTISTLDAAVYNCIANIEVDLFSTMVRSSSIPLIVLQGILEKKINENQLLFADSLGNTCLHCALITAIEHPSFYHALLTKQPKLLNMVNNDLNTALHIACYKIDLLPTIARILVDYGAKLDALNCQGLTPFEIACHTVKCNLASSHLVQDLSWLMPNVTDFNKMEIFQRMVTEQRDL
ncbi:hypothetical protein C9374_013295 [Naegleria lovaniensis]|uniref:Uncharacterized protein n=1 Tax=Naegleria lovaniensis TaxID=51637 RepID=A0AA88KVA5_NAELO|nr:uncharacterized protein C9374_013295 [Naegleria lovaniensis]KAG2391810.1 hypothetical protein C9374_013295 [Naegleria lovaniensis]